MNNGNSPTIFVVDDDRGLLRLIERSLRREGFSVTTADSGATALDWLKANQPDLALFDLKLPDMAGKELISAAASIKRLPPFIIITGQGDERVAVDMMRSGALDYVVKDAHFQELIPAFVRRALDHLDRDRRLATAEREVIESTAQTTAALAELEKLSYSIVHDMRAPLRTLCAFSNILLEEYSGKLDERGKEYLRTIASAAHRQDKLIQDVLAYHAYVRDDFPLVPVNLGTLVSGIVATYANLQWPKVQIQIRQPLGWALAHETLLTQSVSALLDNAAKFVALGVKPEIAIETERTPTEVKLWVKDNGIGIEPQYHRRIFNIFERLHGHDDYAGTGIGLALARKGLEKMHGTMGVQSQAGKGAQFWISLKAIGSPSTSAPFDVVKEGREICSS